MVSFAVFAASALLLLQLPETRAGEVGSLSLHQSLKEQALNGDLKVGTEEWGRAVAKRHDVEHGSDAWREKELHERKLVQAHKVKENWKKHDLDGDGLLDVNEYAEGRSKPVAHNSGMDPLSHAKKAVSIIDGDGDMKLSLKEFFTH